MENFSLSQIGLYNPQRQSPELTEALFVVRQKEFDLLTASLNEESPNSIPQHHLIIAQRGMGKTTLLKRIEVELHKKQYQQKFIPLLFPEEQYGLSDLTKFWLNCLDALADSLEVENYDEKEIDKIDEHIKELMQSKKSNELNEKLYRYLISICKRLNRRPVLLIDNIGLVFNRLSTHEEHVLRGYISDKACPIVISAGVSMAGYSDTKDHVIDYKAPFYDFFQTHHLAKLSLEEFLELLYNLAKVTQTDISITQNEMPRLQSLLQLTGGNPRTSVMLFKLLVNGFSADMVDDLDALLDEITPLYKARFEELPIQQQIILDAIAQNWNPMSLKKISEETRFANNQLSPQLKRLIEDGWLETTKADGAKGNAYSIPERFFSIYHIMRNGSRRSKKQIIYLSRFLECFYGRQSLTRITKSFLNKEFLDEKHRLLAIALVNSKLVNKKTAKQLEEKLFLDIKYISKNDKDYFNKTPYVVDFYKEKMYGELSNAFDKNNSNEAIEIINDLKKVCSEEEGFSLQGDSAMNFSNYEEAEKAFKEVVSLKPDDKCGWCRLSTCLAKRNKYEEAEKAIEKMIELNENDAYVWNIAGGLFKTIEKFDKAEDAYKKSIDLDGNEPQTYFHISKLYVKLNRYDEAEIAVQKFTEIDKNKVNAWNAAGKLYLEMGKHENSEIALKQAIKLDVKNSQVWFSLCNLYVKTNRYDEAEKALLEFTKLDNDNANAWDAAGDLYLAMNKYNEAEQAYRQAIKLDKKNLQVRFDLSNLYIKLNRNDEVEKQIQKIKELDKDNTNIDAVGQLYFEMDKYSEAEKTLKQAVKLDDTNEMSWWRLGISFLNQQKYTEAEAAFRKTIDLDENDASNWHWLSNSLISQEKYLEAENAVRKAIVLDDSNVYSWNILGTALFAQNKYAEPEEIYRKFIELEENDADNRINLGFALSNQEKYSEAIEAFNKAIEVDPNNVMAYRLLGEAYGNQQKHKEAIAYYTKAIELDPQDATLYTRRGYLYGEIGEYAKAIEECSEAILINSDYAIAYNDRGWYYTYTELKDYTKAMADYTKAIELDANCNAKRYLLHLYRDILNQMDKAEEIFKLFPKEPNDVYCLEKTPFALHQRNEGIAKEHLEEALETIKEKLNPETQGSWYYFAAIAISLKYGEWLLKILEENGFDIILSPFFVAIQALEIEKTKNQETAEVYLKNQAIEKSEPARLIIGKMKQYM